MRYCKKCVMPDTRPGIVFDEEGICNPCRAAEQREHIDWDKRFKELEELCDKYRRSDGYYDCIVTVSGGKDSHYQVHVMKELMKMNVLLVNISNYFAWTKAGRHNFANMSRVFGCDTFSLHLNRKATRILSRKAFEKLGAPNWYADAVGYASPLRFAINYNIPLVVYGENICYEYGGAQTKETYSARDQIYSSVAGELDLNFWLGDGITMKELNPMIHPSNEEMEKIDPVYLSYFMRWDGYKNMEFAKKYGFKSLDDTGEWKREGFIEDYDQIDTVGYLVHPWLKYPKFGHARATDVASTWIRTGRITREEGIRLVKEHDHKLDRKALEDFLDFTGYTEEEFWQITDKFYNRDIFEKVDGKWRMKDPIYKV